MCIYVASFINEAQIAYIKNLSLLWILKYCNQDFFNPLINYSCQEFFQDWLNCLKIIIICIYIYYLKGERIYNNISQRRIVKINITRKWVTSLAFIWMTLAVGELKWFIHFYSSHSQWQVIVTPADLLSHSADFFFFFFFNV